PQAAPGATHTRVPRSRCTFAKSSAACTLPNGVAPLLLTAAPSSPPVATCQQTSQSSSTAPSQSLSMPSQPSGSMLGALGMHALTAPSEHAATVIAHAPVPQVTVPSSSTSPLQ